MNTSPSRPQKPTPESAAAFAKRWYAAWNARDLDAIMACYDANIEHSSPFIKRYNGTDDLSIVGIDAVRDYFRRALERTPRCGLIRCTPPSACRASSSCTAA